MHVDKPASQPSEQVSDSWLGVKLVIQAVWYG